ncbi:MAG TPA: ubiquinol-cytochrome c reductase iron-sulfur subunit [Gemmataceae bacterium]|nr:ubiquinol-cytochrome c reductase iron-sulfur subunit [Gemmataceae bacterium]
MPARPTPPARPAPAAAPKIEKRRFFLVAFAIAGWMMFFGTSAATAWTSFTASMLVMTLGTVRFLFPNVLSEPPNKVKVGFPGQYEEGKVSEQFKDKNMWIVRNGGLIYALSTTCTHLGCTPNWLEREGKFKCPCHGSGFKITGINFEGPAPRPLERWSIGIGEDGQIVVDKSRKFQQEMGQWTNSDSYLKT